MKLSIRWKLFVWVNGLIILFVVLTWFMNSSFLEEYYHRTKQKSLLESYKMVNSIYKDSLLDIAFDLELIERLKGLHVIIFNGHMEKIYDTSSNRNIILPERGKQHFSNKRQSMQHSEALIRKYLPEVAKDSPIFINNRDVRLGTDLITLISKLDSGAFLILNTPVTAIYESVKIANRFSLYTGLLIILLGSILILIFSKSVTSPILELNKIARRMATLDFSQKYKVKSNDEVGMLGKSINSMSGQLSNSIKELLESNMALKKEIEKERQIEKMRKEFISNVSHELKTPIALIQGYAEGLKVNVNDDEESKNFYCDVIVDEANKMNMLVKQLLNLAYIQSGHMKLNIEKFDITNLISEVAAKNSILFQQKNVKAVFNDNESVEVHADRSKIEQVLMNYVSNAINHVYENGTIKINYEDKGNKVEVKVFNTGRHIPEKELEKIWSSFYKVDRARTRNNGSTGLGLSIVKAIIELHHNRFGAKNVDKGVEFWFELDKGS